LKVRVIASGVETKYKGGDAIVVETRGAGHNTINILAGLMLLMLLGNEHFLAVKIAEYKGLIFRRLVVMKGQGLKSIILYR